MMARKRKPINWPVWIAAHQNDYDRDSIIGVFWTEAAAKEAAGEHGYVAADEITALTPETARRQTAEAALRELLRLWDRNEIAPHDSADVGAIQSAFDAARAEGAP